MSGRVTTEDVSRHWHLSGCEYCILEDGLCLEAMKQGIFEMGGVIVVLQDTPSLTGREVWSHDENLAEV